MGEERVAALTRQAVLAPAIAETLVESAGERERYLSLCQFLPPPLLLLLFLVDVGVAAAATLCLLHLLSLLLCQRYLLALLSLPLPLLFLLFSLGFVLAPLRSSPPPLLLCGGWRVC